MKKFEYKAYYESTLKYNNENGYKPSSLNDLGADGWELVSVMDSAKYGVGYQFFFKRELTE